MKNRIPVEERDWLSMKEVGDELGVSRHIAQRLVETGRLKAVNHKSPAGRKRYMCHRDHIGAYRASIEVN